MKAKNSHPESAARSVYERMIGVFFFFKPIPDLDEIVHQDFSGYGTAAHEFFKTRKDVIQMAITQAEQLQQQKIEIIRKPILERFLIDGTTYLIVEEFELYLVQDDHRLSTRLSTILEHINDKWMVTHFHGSTPDSNIAEEEAFPMEGLRKKNEALEAKIKERTRDLEIEGALERVRTRTMAMHKSEELAETAIVLYEQFSLLGNIPDRMSICIFKEDSRKLEFWPTDQSGSKLNNKFAGSWERSPIMIKIYNAWKAKDSSLVADLSGQDLKEWLKFIREEVKLFVDDTHIKGRRVQQAAFFSHGFLLITTNEPIADEIMQLLIRFAGVFSQTYTRFLDLQKAEAQAREAQIEGALERVRTRTMAMHNTDDIAETVTTFFNELLGLHPDSSIRCGIGILSQSEHMELWTASVKGGSETVLHAGTLDMSIHPLLKGVKETWSKKKKSFTYTLKGKEVKTYFQILNEAPDYPAHFDLKAIPKVVHHNSFVFRDGVLFVFTGNVLQDDIRLILERFTAVFGQTYTRYLDLKKAEAQARESQIQLSLERVRAKSLAMQSSDELHEVLGVLFRQFDNLGIHPVNVFLSLFDRQERTLTYRASGKSGKRIPGKQIVHVDSMEALQTLYDKWLNDNSDTIEVIYYPKEVLPQLFGIFSETFSSMPKADRISAEDFPDGGYSMAGYTPFGYLGYDHQREATTEEKKILSRFCNEFTRIYQRFLDLQKAEAHAREAQIEAALEKVRSQSLAMHSTGEMQQVANAVYDQLQKLGVVMDAVGMSGVIEAEKDYDVWIGGATMGKALRIPYNEDTKVQRDYNKAIKERADLFASTYKGKIKEEYINHLLTHGEFPKALKKKMVTSTAFCTSIAFAKNSGIQIARYTREPYTAEENELLKRFARVFEQAYIRFMDLEKAEAQAREAQIEVALERVRSRAMGMHHTDELTDVLGVLFDQFDFLGINPVLTHLTLFDEANETFTLRIARGGKKRVIAEQLIDVNAVESWKTSFANWKKSELHALDCIDYPPEVLPAVWEVLDGVMTALPEGQKIYPEDFPNGLYTTQGHCKYGYIGFNHSRRATEEEKDIVIRFAKEFGRLYQRFLDIKKAEGQAREAQIEGALERVRSKTMAMHNSEDLEDIVISLFDEVLNLGVDKSIRCGIGILEGHEGMETRSVNANPDGTLELKTGMLNMSIHPMLVGLKKAWKSGSTEYSYDYTEKDIRKYYEALNNEPEYSFNANLEALPERQFHRSFFFSSGILFAFSETPISEESSKILARFAAVFGQTYQRFLDLQKAEERAKDAIKQASLDRVRGQIASMRSAEDLERITPLVFNELTTLGIPFIRCGVFIIEESNKTVQAFLSAPDGRSLGAMRIPFDAEKNTAETVAHWRKGEVYRTHWDKRQFLEFMQTMIDLGQVNNNKEYQGAEEPPESLHLHFVPFRQGMLYVGSEASLTVEQIELVQSLADAFAIAYARYEDFDKLEKAKERVETALSELKTTQNQLVQSEKMASLGELTAGIAHEIQNPLNFVNNFSEVSNELIDEMNEEIDKGDLKEAKAIAKDIKQNLEKINHHGKRADGIVKGMLQHSRASSGEKEPTDINTLADEYLRLAYHGLRAIDKSFNATLETHFDKTIGKVNVIPQDMGRVILNLITNAFYVVKEKSSLAKASEDDTYEPTVTVSTKKTKKGIEIRVKDNGNGIPEGIKEKIFQPFFTTKPTGQGTGLGLSMSYDIVTKGHKGELKVNSKEGEGTTFTIVLPIVKETKKSNK